ncbi:MAG: NUDIX hydrolase [Thermoflexales bacterium]|nr:NUDIX hydrolase [Thermoflexales bacterium]
MTDRAHLPDWLHWARRIEAIAQAGLTYCESAYDRERYSQLRALAAEILSAHTGASDATVLGWFDGQPGYATPKVDVRAACFRGDAILLVRERSDGRWCLPGGWADVGDAPAASAEREVFEEAGFTARAERLIGVFDANRNHEGGKPLSYYHAYKLIFACGIEGGQPPEHTHEISEIGFFTRDALPPLSEARTNRAQLERCFSAHADPSLDAHFE